MKGKSTFTQSEANAIIALIRKKVVADTNEQKRLRDKIRALGFYATDFGIGGGYTEHDFLSVVKIIGAVQQVVPKPDTSKQSSPTSTNDSKGKIRKFSFPPVSKPDARILILGTMPGERSLALNQYYGHGGNQFWKIMFACFNKPYSADYIIKTKLLNDHRIALWDVLEHCEREGSSDKAIISEFPNDFKSFFIEHPNIKTVFFNGNKAAVYFQKHIGFADGFKYEILPSTSPANTWSTKEEKLEKWKQAIKVNC
jgi:hypoxanthine-DNA glycosylase